MVWAPRPKPLSLQPGAKLVFTAQAKYGGGGGGGPPAKHLLGEVVAKLGASDQQLSGLQLELSHQIPGRMKGMNNTLRKRVRFLHTLAPDSA
mmetsp:Transcript_33061/g.104611  ORF Transcript_33061/g.104611 Transcript_33061/m.104611 type:complete len:92 (+) Transcript_33061:83-358(+)